MKKSIYDISYQAQRIMNELVRQEMKEKKQFNEKRYILVSNISKRYINNIYNQLKNERGYQEIAVSKNVYAI